MSEERTFFNESELLLDYTEFKHLWERDAGIISDDLREWLYSWHSWDMANSPMDDKMRSQIRFGHYLGWEHRVIEERATG